MKSSRREIELTRPVVLASLTVLAVSLLGGCSTKTIDYTVPDSLCGTRLPRELLRPLLPPGDRLKSHLDDSSLDGGEQHCQLSVDKKEALVVSTEWYGERWSAAQVADLQPELDAGTVSGNNDFQYGEKGAVKRVTCRHPRQDGWGLFVIAQITGRQEPGVKAIRKLTATYAKAVEKSKQCDR